MGWRIMTEKHHSSFLLLLVHLLRFAVGRPRARGHFFGDGGFFSILVVGSLACELEWAFALSNSHRNGCI